MSLKCPGSVLTGTYLSNLSERHLHPRPLKIQTSNFRRQPEQPKRIQQKQALRRLKYHCQLDYKQTIDKGQETTSLTIKI